MSTSAPALQAPTNPHNVTVKHTELYLPDGDLVISCPTKQSGSRMLFRVDRIFLSRHSAIFKDMFSLPPRPDGGVEQYDGAPFVCIPDEAEDMASFLEVQPIESYGVLKLATKYPVDSLSSLIIHHLRTEWPQNLKEWDLLQADIGQASFPPHITGISDKFPEPASLVRLVNDCNCPKSLLIPAFYTFSIVDYRTRREDAQNNGFARFSIASRWSLLEKEELLQLARGRAELADIIEDDLMFMLEDGTIEKSPPHCPYNRYWRPNRDMELDCPFEDVLIEYKESRGTPSVKNPDPLAILYDYVKFCDKYMECRQCATTAKRSFTEYREGIWNKLPALFGLDTEEGN
ncbi:hypothetical protein C8Q75DRAFT_805559 [Abortiporus biennis]|nr:hypothetical protein C8Q75DRAFT_805559 [Abortiporus biennis]